jgi:uracil-DNA glycosylase
MNVALNESWKKRLQKEFSLEYFERLAEYVKSEYKAGICYPPGKNIFSAFDHCSFEETKVVIIGQDPYHGPGQANGLCFSVNEGVRIPPSLVNIFKEIESDLGIARPISGDLRRWARQGVLLLNATLTVRANEAGSHQNKGWEQFTDAVIRHLNEERENLVFLLWGSFAQKKGAMIDSEKHLILKSVHPSPLSAYNGFFGSKHFSQANAYLEKQGQPKIQW